MFVSRYIQYPGFLVIISRRNREKNMSVLSSQKWKSPQIHFFVQVLFKKNK